MTAPQRKRRVSRLYPALLYAFHLGHLPGVFQRQWWPRERIAGYQDRLLRELVAHAYRNAAHYRRLMDGAGLTPGDIRAAADLRRLPITTKADILNSFPEGILASDRREGAYQQTLTSGSSGRPMPVCCDKEQLALYRLMELRQLWSLGYRPTDLMAFLKPHAPKGRPFQRLGFFRRAFVSILDDVGRQAEALLKLRPQVIYAYPSSLYLLAQHLDGGSARGLALKFILSNSELLTPEVRGCLEEKFGCPIYDEYSCLEFQAIGFECQHKRLHLAADNVIAEVVDEAGQTLPPGRPGRLILTALHNRVMPYLRYEIGDMGALSEEPCPCGRGFAVIAELQGRQDDFIAAPGGRLLSPRVVCRPFRTTPGIRDFQILQEADGSVRVRVCGQPGCDGARLDALIREAVAKAFPPGMRVAVETVGELDRGATGKHRAVRSLARGR